MLYQFGSPTDPKFDDRGYIIEENTHPHTHSRTSSDANIGRSGSGGTLESMGSLGSYVIGISSGDPYDDFNKPKKEVDSKGKRAIVKVRNAYKRYDRKGPRILNGFSITVESGTIYSLLGSNGCGKTTALTCILGIRNLDKGKIEVCGKCPGTKESGVPGRRVGYMPQETALYGRFSIDETLHYYGTLYGMSLDNIKARRDFIMAFLELPDKDHRVSKLSPGQQRRVSLAVALIHNPKLLILDEPTVGVDSLLREKIWSHLVQLIEDEGTTVIITTHYIEEARQSNMVGIMRGGRLLEENNPAVLMVEHGVLLLEEIVLKLCRNDQELSTSEIAVNGDVDMEQQCSVLREQRDAILPWDSAGSGADSGAHDGQTFNRKCCRIRALILKILYVMWRNLVLVLFMILVPSLLVVLICAGFGNDPRPVPLGVVNHEANFAKCDDLAIWRGPLKPGCDMKFLSCKYLEGIPKESIKLKEYESVSEARKGVEDGDTWGYIVFAAEYTDSVTTRVFGGASGVINEDVLDKSFITYQMDMTSRQISGYIKKVLSETYEGLIKKLLSNCGLNVKLGDPPVKGLDPIFGSNDTDFREFIAPSFLLGFLFFFPMCCSAIMYIVDKKQGTLERALVAGATTTEIMVSYFVVEGLVLIMKLGLSLVVIALAFGFEIKGSITWLIVLYMLVGVTGVSAGFVLGTFCADEVQAVLIAMAGFFPNFLLSGLLWPIEGMPYWMQYITYALPCTLAGESVRSIMSRGWGIGHDHVWPGFVIPIGWIFLSWVLTITIGKFIHRRK